MIRRRQGWTKSPNNLWETTVILVLKWLIWDYSLSIESHVCWKEKTQWCSRCHAQWMTVFIPVLFALQWHSKPQNLTQMFCSDKMSDIGASCSHKHLEAHEQELVVRTKVTLEASVGVFSATESIFSFLLCDLRLHRHKLTREVSPVQITSVMLSTWKGNRGS